MTAVVVHPDPIVRPRAPKGDHQIQLDGLRFFAFLGVFLFHYNEPLFWYGSRGVQLFFVLSGFLITRLLILNEGPSLKGTLRTFYARRVLRILPLYYVAVIGMQLLGLLDSPQWFWLNLVNFGTYRKQHFLGYLGHFWSLAVEEQFYLCFPLILLGTPRRFRMGLVVGLLAVCATSRFYVTWRPVSFGGMLPWVAGEYLLVGSLVGLLDLRGSETTIRRGWLAWAGLVTTTLWVLFDSRIRRTFGVWNYLSGEVLTLSFAALILGLWHSRGILNRGLSSWPFPYLGKISYGLYVYHLPMLNFTWTIYDRYGLWKVRGMHRVTWLVALALTIGISALSWHLMERPILKLKSRFPYRRIDPDRPGPAEKISTIPAVASRAP